MIEGEKNGERGKGRREKAEGREGIGREGRRGVGKEEKEEG